MEGLFCVIMNTESKRVQTVFSGGSLMIRLIREENYEQMMLGVVEPGLEARLRTRCPSRRKRAVAAVALTQT